MKTLFPRLSHISLNDWLEYHPYDREVSSDHFYIGFSNDMQHEMLFVDIEDNLVGADYKFLACMLTCYLEDIISQTGMWTAFINEHFRLYGKYLPFYDMEGYEPGDINLADIQFLIWHFCSNLSVQHHFVDPYSIENTEIAKVVFTLLNEASGQAPVNDDLKTALILPPDADFHKVTSHLDFVFFGCYLHHYYFSTLLEEEKLHVKNQKNSRRNFDQLLNDRRMHLLFNRVSPLLAQSSGEMLARWAGEAHPLYRQLLSLTKRKEGIFLYEGVTDTHFQMKHLSSETSIELMTPDWTFPLTPGMTKVRMGVVSWDGEWYAAGAAFPVTDTKKTKRSEEEKCLFASVASHLGVIKREEECFLEINNNKRILFLESKLETSIFIERVWEMYHLRYGTENMDRRPFEVHDLTFNVDDDFDNLVIFFNPHAGIEFYPNIAQCISLFDNIYYDRNAETDIEDLILDKQISSDFIFFLIEKQMIEIEPLSGEGGFHYVWANCDFLLRYWKREAYLSEPKLFF